MLILVRHGRTAANAEGRMQGTADNPLDETGRRQAELVGRTLAHSGRVVASPAARAQATAQAIATAGEPLVTDRRWIELDFGVYDGLPISDVPADVWTRWRSDPEWSPENGESTAQLQARVEDACHDLAAEATDSDVVVVSHVSPIKAAVAWALGSTGGVAWRTHLDVASITRIDFRRDTPILMSFNETLHLNDI